MKEKLTAAWAVLKEKKWLLLLALAGVVLLLLGGKSGKTEAVATAPLDAAEKYRATLEEEVRLLCEEVAGVGQARVLLTLSSTESADYAADENASGRHVVTSGGGALCSGYRMPEIAGVAVVCDGGGNEGVKTELTRLIGAALGISTARVHISPAK